MELTTLYMISGIMLPPSGGRSGDLYGAFSDSILKEYDLLEPIEGT